MPTRYVPLFWRLFIPNATVMGVACVVLWAEPANGRIPALAGGLVVMVLVNLLLIRHAVAPLSRLTSLMDRVDPLEPGRRLPQLGPGSEIALLTRAFNDMLDRIEAERRDSGLRALSEREEERRRIAAELHDGIGQNLTAIALALDRLPEDNGRVAVARLRDEVLATIEEVRGLARDLRPEALDALGLVPALTNLVERLADQTGIAFERRLQRDLPPLGPEGELVVYRVAQEAITNAIRHATAAHISVSLAADRGDVVLEVRDDGVGIRPRARDDRGSGMRTMRERALTVGGRLEVMTAQDTGTGIRLTVPAVAVGAP